MNLLKLSWKNLINKPLSLFLSLVLFALGIGLISLLFLVDKQLQENFERNLAGIDLVIGAKGSPLQMILSSMYHIDAPTGNISLKEARPFLNPNHPIIENSVPLALGDSYRSFRIVGTNKDFIALYNGELESGELWHHNFEITIGARVARELDLTIGDEFNSAHGFEDNRDLEHSDAESFQVVGILKPSGTILDQLILTTPQSYWHVHGYDDDESIKSSAEEEFTKLEEAEEHDHHEDIQKPLLEEDEEQEITSLLVKFKARNYRALNMQRNINENTDLQAATPAIEINRLFSLMNSGEQALRILAIIITFVSGLSIFISLFSSLKARKYELALMRVLGAGPKTVFLMIILEGLLIAICGFLVGIAISHIGMEVFSGFMSEKYNYSFTGLQFLQKEWLLLLGAIGIGFIAAVIPAIQASRTDIAETLTSE